MTTLKFRNQSESIPRLAIFKKSYSRPSLGLVAWAIVAPSRGGLCQVEVPGDYGVYISTGDENDPFGACRTRKLSLAAFSAQIQIIAQPTDDRSDYVPDIVQTDDKVVENEVHLVNSYGRGVWGHILQGDSDIYPPQIISPGEVLMVDARPSFWVAHISEHVRKGAQIVEGQLSTAPVEVMPGQTLIVQGSRMGGFRFDLA
jgi:hypothetical protein